MCCVIIRQSYLFSHVYKPLRRESSAVSLGENIRDAYTRVCVHSQWLPPIKRRQIQKKPIGQNWNRISLCRMAL